MKIKQVNFELSDSDHRKLKSSASLAGMTIQGYVLLAIRNLMGSGGGGASRHSKPMTIVSPRPASRLKETR